ncbi:MAG: ATP-dependent DNA ligase [Aquabacterium sp.]|nr:ATP-dependent DNA ligase [Aquabacterium sp.]
MKAFSALFAALDQTTSTRAKTEALVAYFGQAPAADAAWALYFLAGGKPRQAVPGPLIQATACEAAGIAPWLFDESHQIVGDLAETVALILPPPRAATDLPLHQWVEQRLLPLRALDPAEQRDALLRYWGELDTAGRFLLTKLIGGGFRVGVARLLVLRALAEASGVEATVLAQRFIGYTDKTHVPSAAAYEALLRPHGGDEGPRPASGQPYPFFLSHQLQAAPETLGSPTDWQVEWKWDGIRAQLVRRAGQCWIWSRGEDLITDRFPELVALAGHLPDGTVLDGEILIWRDGAVQPFAQLQTRIGRKTLSKKTLAETPAAFMAYDLLEQAGQDLRGLPLRERRDRLQALVAEVRAGAMRPSLEGVCPAPAIDTLQLSEAVTAPDWATLATLRQASRERRVEGFMLKHRDSRYGIGRTKEAGLWWKWKIDPLSIDAVIVYAQRGHGRRANLYTDFTFAVWDGPQRPGAERRLVPFAKAYSGLTDEEMARVDQRIRQTVTEKFGPVRAVTPTLVVELGFEGIQASPRHKSGIAVRFPRMLRLRWDKPVEEADTLQSLQALLDLAGPRSGPVAAGADAADASDPADPADAAHAQDAADEVAEPADGADGAHDAGDPDVARHASRA